MFTASVQISPQEVNTIATSQRYPLGVIGVTADGRSYRYSQAGSSDLTIGKLTVAQAKVANHTNLAVFAAAAVGDKVVTVTLGGTAATQDQYKNGYLVVIDVAGVGQHARIAGNTAQTSTTGQVTVYLEDALTVALTTSSKASLVFNPWSGLATATTTTAVVTGVPQYTLTANNFGWIQTGGMASVLSDGVIAKATGAIQSGSVAGAATTEATSTVTQRIGLAPEATVDTKYYPIYLNVLPID